MGIVDCGASERDATRLAERPALRLSDGLTSNNRADFRGFPPTSPPSSDSRASPRAKLSRSLREEEHLSLSAVVNSLQENPARVIHAIFR